MNIYFSGSIRGGRQDAKTYNQLIDELKKFGDVLTEHVGSSEISSEPTDREIHRQDMQWLKEANLLIGEVTTPSHGVGYEIGYAVAMGKPVFCLHQKKEEKALSAMLNGDPAIKCFEYAEIEEARAIIQNIFTNLQ
ncbi:nucleoside 2-deoxyribosyltransferase [Aliifodinibius halophilus]|uniref:Putative 2'-deoxynucleoside 5'-phosphate N-hydrolase 1 n=2 Tax=Fodinibius halophilus TaxID=1736908 RepID=A0A6M1THC0_9BACT|nr:nucleoside 2-deoxyribosyltransferase [Fodinibius halophilus]